MEKDFEYYLTEAKDKDAFMNKFNPTGKPKTKPTDKTKIVVSILKKNLTSKFVAKGENAEAADQLLFEKIAKEIIKKLS